MDPPPKISVTFLNAYKSHIFFQLFDILVSVARACVLCQSQVFCAGTSKIRQEQMYMGEQE